MNTLSLMPGAWSAHHFLAGVVEAHPVKPKTPTDYAPETPEGLVDHEALHRVMAKWQVERELENEKRAAR